MSDSFEVITARPHTPEYLLHKYWARKPHNVISHFIRKLAPHDGLVLDPFCGSGVVLHEAQKLGIRSLGLDINPVAILNTRVLTDPPDCGEFCCTVESILAGAAPAVNASYSTDDGRVLKYLVHQSETRCPSCHSIAASGACEKQGRKCLCPRCGAELRFNLESFTGSHITAASPENGREMITENGILLSQQERSLQPVFGAETAPYNFPFTENRRILAYRGMQTRTLFTVRNFDILCQLASEFEQLPDERIRRAALLLLTASAAQCSRLIPCRNNLSTGGPSWSVPGFWAPAKHLETNPVIHLRARLNKFRKGLAEINRQSLTVFPVIKQQDCLQYLKKESVKADLIFLDPPYGDNVPYTEFSAMWNSFLKLQPDVEQDLSVSDRMSREKSWLLYREKLKELLSITQNLLNPSGHLLITFNNNDQKAWEALISALQMNHYICDDVTYVLPAVISSKAQFSPRGSYISDIYSVYSYQPQVSPTQSLTAVTSALIKCASVRKEGIARNLVYRTIMLEWIRNNLSCELLNEIPRLVSSLFVEKREYLEYIGPRDPEAASLEELTNDYARRLLSHGPCDWNDFYIQAAAQFCEYGFLDSGELRSLLDGHIIFSENRCLAYIE